MKTIIKKTKKFFKSIWKFIDKRIVLPITKFLLKFDNGKDSSGKQFENLLSKKNTLLFISLFFALVTFIIIDQKIVTFSKNSAEVLRSLPVTAIYNEEAYVAEGLPSTVDITLIGSKTDLFIAKQMSSYDVTVDLTGLKPGQHKVNVKYNQSLTDLEYMVNPSLYAVIPAGKTLSDSLAFEVDELEELGIDNINEIQTSFILKDKEYEEILLGLK